MPLEEDIAKAYLDYYTHDVADPARTAASRLLFSVLGLDISRRRAENCYLDDQSPGRVLEIGFGDGGRLRRLAALGWQVEGQEVDPTAIQKARDAGFEVHEGRLRDLNLPDSSYDAVIGNHVIEHVHSPLEVLNACRRITRPGGLVIMVTPNITSYGHRVFGRHWLGLDPPRHLHLFTLSSMDLLLKMAGFINFRLSTRPALSAIPFQASMNKSRSGVFQYGRKSSWVIQTGIARHVSVSRFLTLLNRRWGEEIVIVAEA
jgi:2-polyprenyl-3-methyl-5-hydroxy-6-metoxy-1,4-benzoquinol methylase